MQSQLCSLRRGHLPRHRARQSTCWRQSPCCRASRKGSLPPQAPIATTADASAAFQYRVSPTQGASKLRLDAFLVAQIAKEQQEAPPGTPLSLQDVSRAKIQASIAAGLVLVNGRPAAKASAQLRAGDVVSARILPPPPMQAAPEAIPLDIHYEDEHLIVVNKPPGMVVHIAPGHHSGTLVNALLHHCGMPAIDLAPGTAPHHSSSSSNNNGGALDEPDLDTDLDEDEDADTSGGVVFPGGSGGWEVPVSGSGRHAAAGSGGGSSSSGSGSGLLHGGGVGAGNPAAVGSLQGGAGSGAGAGAGVFRPGIVHRIDKGTSGLLVVAKSEAALTRLQAQFKARTVDRLYTSVTVGCPAAAQGRVETNIVRDPADRKRMAAAAYGSGRGRTAASNYTVVRSLAGGGAAVVRWKLDTGRTHQIRVHAKHIGHPLFGDEPYGGSGPKAAALVARRGGQAAGSSTAQQAAREALEALGRPALHAQTLGFDHPVTGRRMAFEQPPPEDLLRAIAALEGM